MIIKNKYYHPNNSVLVIAGDVHHDEAFTMANKIFGDWQNSGFNPIEKYPIPEFAPLASTEYFVKESTIAKTPYAMYWWQGPDTRRDSAGTIAADVFSTILGMNSSKWQQALVDKGLSSYAGVNYQTQKYVGPISIFVIPNPNKLKECHQEIIKQISMWNQNDYFTDEQLNDAKQILRRNQIRRDEKPSDLPHQFTYFWTSASPEYYTDYIDNIMKISRADIQKYISNYITGKHYVAGIIINAEMNKAANTSQFFIPTN
jgi:zinc protease